jgi:hypothetical protein
MTGEVGILNIGAGDTKLIFDPNNPQDSIRAARIVKDMLRRGYSLLVAVPGSDPVMYQRAYDFDENTCEYIIADMDPTAFKEELPSDENTTITGEHFTQVAPSESAASTETAEAAAFPQAAPVRTGKGKGKRGTKRVPASSTKATAVARTAGG